MKKHTAISIIIILLLGVSTGFAAKVVPLKELARPEGLEVDDSRFYITGGTRVYIYSLKDFKLVRQFGKRGEGPEEFVVYPGAPMAPFARTDELLITSMGKISFFTKDGVYKRELKTKGSLFYLLPAGDGFLGMALTQDKGISNQTINIYDAKLTPVREVYRQVFPEQRSGPIKVYDKAFSYEYYDNKIFIPHGTELSLRVLDMQGKQLYTMGDKGFERPPVAEVHKKQVHDFMKTNPDTKTMYEVIKSRLEFPSHFPGISYFWVNGGMVYLMTWKEKTAGSQEFEFYIFDVKGKFIKKKFIHIPFSEIAPQRVVVYKGKVYHIAENEKKEMYELHINGF